MKSLIDYFVKRSFVVNIICLGIFFAGIIAIKSTHRDLVPPFDFKQITISATLPGASPVEMEKYVTFPIEESIKGLVGVEEMTSTTSNGYTYINISFKPGFDDMLESLETVRSRVQSIQTDLPQDLDPIQISQSKTDSSWIVGAAAMNIDDENEIHRDWIHTFEDRVRKIEGVVNISSELSGKNIYIYFDSKKLSQFEISVSEARTALQNFLAYQPVGKLDINEKEIAIELKKKINNIDEIQNLPVKSNRSGNTIKLKQIATVTARTPEEKTIGLMNGKKGVWISIYKDLDSDAIHVRDQIQEIMDDLNAKVPNPISFEISGDGAYYVERQLEVLRNNAITGLIIVLTLLILILGWKTALVTAWGIPVAYLGAFVFLSFFGVSVNLVSIVGMILIVGVIVDDAVIVAEQYSSLIEEGLDPETAARKCSQDLLTPVTGTIITTIIAFSPMLIFESRLSDMLFAIPLVVISALSLSWFECFFILPNHLYHLVGTQKVKKVQFFEKIKVVYDKYVRFCLNKRYWVLLGVVILFIFSFFVAGNNLKKEFNLNIRSEALIVYAFLNESESAENTKEKIQPITDYLTSLPKEEVNFIWTSIGRSWFEGKEKKGNRYARFWLRINPKAAKPSKIAKKLEDVIQEKLKTLKTSDFEILTVQNRQSMDDNSKKDIVTISVGGGDKLSFETIENEVKEAVQGINGVTDVYYDKDRLIENWKFHLDSVQALSYGFQPSQITAQLREIFTEQELGKIRLRGEFAYIYTHVDQKEEKNFEELNRLEIINSQGLSVPLRYLGKWEKTDSLKDISHKNLLRVFEIDVKYDADKTKIEDVTQEVKTKITPLQSKYPSYEIKIEEGDVQQKKNREWSVKVLVFCIGFILFVLALVLGSVIQPLIVGAAIPFGIIGALWALYTHGFTMGVMAVIGLLGVAGVAVNDSLIMVDKINSLKKDNDGLITLDVIALGAVSRLRAIFLTTITTLGGVFPMAYALGGESGFTQPLAFSLGWGLTSATFLTLTVIPVLVAVHQDVNQFFGNAIKRFKHK